MKLQPRDFQVECRRHRINARMEPAGVLGQIPGGDRLDREAHVHDLDRMAFRMGRTSNPSMEASMALTGSTSVTTTRAPIPRARIAIPRPVHPYPATTKVFPAI